MKRPIIPGHAFGYTFWLLSAFALFATIAAKDKIDVVWIILAIIAVEMGSQATHLHQHDHGAVAATSLEQELKEHHKFWRPVCIAIAIICATLAIT